MKMIFSELQPSISSPLEARVKDHKRHDSLALVEENGTIPPKCDATSEPHFDRENILNNKVYNTMKSVPGCSAKVETGFITSLDFVAKFILQIYILMF